MRAMREELAQHVGGHPNIAQKCLIERISVLSLRLSLLDRKTATGAMSDRDRREYLALHGAFTRTLKQLGMKSAKKAAPDLADYLALRAAADATAPGATP